MAEKLLYTAIWCRIVFSYPSSQLEIGMLDTFCRVASWMLSIVFRTSCCCLNSFSQWKCALQLISMPFQSSFHVHVVVSTFLKFLRSTKFSEQPNLLQRCTCPSIPTGFTVVFSTITPDWKCCLIQTGNKVLLRTATPDWKRSFF